MVDTTMQAQFAEFTDRLLRTCIRAVEDLDVEQINHRPIPNTNSIGFDIWHAVRTVDNIVMFAFDRERPAWLAEGFDERFGLPRVEQGTGMPDEEAHRLRFPDAAGLVDYVNAVRGLVVPKLAGATTEYLEGTVLVRPWGEVPRMQHVNQLVMSHGNAHVGRASFARTLIGKDGLI